MIKQEGLPDVGESGDVLEPTEREDHPHWDRDGVHEIFREWRKVADRYDGDRVVHRRGVGERPEAARPLRTPRTSCTPRSTSTTCAPRGSAERLREVIDASLDALGSVGAPATWVLSNHDVVRHVTRYGRAHTEGRGPRADETEPLDLALGTRRARAAALLMLALPGGAYVYQGEELGPGRGRGHPGGAAAGPRLGTFRAHRHAAVTAAACRSRGPATPRRSASARTG